jgi:hypothetical protein
MNLPASRWIRVDWIKLTEPFSNRRKKHASSTDQLRTRNALSTVLEGVCITALGALFQMKGLGAIFLEWCFSFPRFLTRTPEYQTYLLYQNLFFISFVNSSSQYVELLCLSCIKFNPQKYRDLSLRYCLTAFPLLVLVVHVLAQIILR